MSIVYIFQPIVYNLLFVKSLFWNNKKRQNPRCRGFQFEGQFANQFNKTVKNDLVVLE